MNLHRSKWKKIAAAVIAVLLVASMVLSVLLAAFV